MSHRIYRLLFVLFVLAFSTRMFAQSEIGISINGSELNESRFDDDDEEVVIDFEEGIGVGRFSPFVVGGIAFIGGELETETTWTVASGANIQMIERISITLESKHIEWSAKPEDATDVERLDLDPLLLSAGIKFRF